jgi:hypothetical protein
MADVTSPSLAEAYAAVRSDSNPTTWAVLGYSNGDQIVVESTGTGGIAEMANHFKDDACQYGYVRVTTGDEESKRAKFVLISWGGRRAGILRKAKMSVHKADVKTIFKDFAYETHAEERDEIDEKKIIDAVVKAGGANYMGQSC